MTDVKTILRKGILHNRRLLQQEVFQQRTDKVLQKALDLVSRLQKSYIHLFLPIRKNKEVDTWPLLESLTEAGKQVILSSTDFHKRTMSHYVYGKSLLFEEDAYGIPTPIGGASADLDKVELIFIPLLAADNIGDRIGYGKGYYDMLLAGMPSGVAKVGLSLCPPFDRFSFAEPHDVRLNYLITPAETLEFND